MNVMNYAAMSRHSTEQKHQSNTIPREGSPEVVSLFSFICRLA